MKNLFDSLTKGNLGSVGEHLSGALGGSPLAGMADKISGAFGQQQAGPSAPQGAGQGAAAPGSPNVGSPNLGGLGGLLGAGALGGLLGALMSGKTAQKVAKGALVVGGTAAVGALAWNFYQKWSQNAAGRQAGPQADQQAQQAVPQSPYAQAQAAPQPLAPQAAPAGWSVQLNPVPEAIPAAPAPAPAPAPALAPAPAPAEDTAQLLLEAMVFAARADGHIDDKEQGQIQQAVSAMFPQQDMGPFVESLLHKPLDPGSLAARIHTAEEAQDLYRLSCMIVDVDHFMERSYLDGLASALRIPAEVKTLLEQEVAQAKAAA